MKYANEIPSLYIYKQDKRTSLGCVPITTEFTSDIRFNACSEIQFKTPSKYYDESQEAWVDNQVYDSIERGKLIFVTDDNEYFKYPVRAIGDSTFYKYKSDSSSYRRGATLSLNQNPLLENFEVQSETELFDIGQGGGYSFRHFAYIDDDVNGELGSVRDMSYLHWSTAAATYNPRLALDVYIPAEATDVISIWSGHTHLGQSNDKADCNWRIAAYEREDAASYVGMWKANTIGSQRINVGEKLPNGGYLRFWYECSTGDGGSSSYTYSTSSGGTAHWWYPVQGYAKLYSGERRCTLIKNSDKNGYMYPKMHWYQVVSVDEEDDGIARTKTVTAYSYEYTLHSSTFSLSASTLPLYIPDAITSLVSGSRWVRDYYENGNRYYSPQRMQRGVLNQILDYLPNWSIKYVSEDLMTTYRSLDDADDVNIYSYLTDTIQSIYNCFIVFDNDEMTISAYSLSDINDIKSSMYLNWDNAIKHFEKTNMDASYFTALRVHAGDDTYGIGLVNPTGNGMIYNFDRIIDELDFVTPGVPSNQSTYKRPLKNAVESWLSYYNSQLSGWGSSSYNIKARELIQANMELIQAEGERSIALADYRAKGDTINMFLEEDYNSGKLPGSYSLLQISETPWTVSRIQNGLSYIQDSAAWQFHNAKLQSELAMCANAYWKADKRVNDARTAFNSAQTAMQAIAHKLSMSYSYALSANGNAYSYSNDTTLLSANEIKELSKYIIEGTWTYENAAFSENYNADDIQTTLIDVLYAATFDLKHRLSIANFDFSIDSANVMAIPEFETSISDLYLASQSTIEVSDTEIITPMLLEMHRNYKDDNDFSFTFTTDMKRKPIQFRFADLYSTITQTSVTDNTFTFDT